MNSDLRLVYGWVKGSRERVFAWLDTLPPEVYTLERQDFAYGSLRNIQAHIAQCYLVWVGARGLGLKQYQQRRDAATLRDVPAMRAAFQEVDDVLEQAFGQFTELDAPLEVEMREEGHLRVTQRWLVMHPVTHEFHHKGQMLALGRVLGYPYPPGPDTDLVLPF
ncbi:DinB family protein [Deinococcus apachensis]|uniref:DinB family protein n=1 Tax=Deinococcus apachensis TaxID=309886 RepID=UPI00038075E1|nr:DinB family protein [Deinococcus apachensis]